MEDSAMASNEVMPGLDDLLEALFARLSSVGQKFVHLRYQL
jgi:hypothetical protein